MSLHKQRKALLNTFFAVILFLAVGIISDISNKPETKGIDVSSISEGTHVVTDVVDGDTIKVENSTDSFTVRLIGINTPETKDPRKDVECFGKEASDRLTALLDGQTVQLVSDESQLDTDRYDRLLRYVILEDGTNVNYQMIREGFAYEYTYSEPYKYQSDFKDAQAYAKENKLGLWSDTTCNGSL